MVTTFVAGLRFSQQIEALADGPVDRENEMILATDDSASTTFSQA
jgi:hypothetical protein